MDQFVIKTPQPNKVNANSTKSLEDETLLLIVDVQQKLINNIKDKKLLIFNIKRLIDACNLLNVRIAITEQNPLKLGKTLESITDNNEYPKFEKMEFSCSKNMNFINYISQYK